MDGSSPHESRDRSWVELFHADAEMAVLRVLQRAGAALSAVEVKHVLQAGGVGKVDADRAWPGVQKRIRSHEHVVVESGHRYRWTARARDSSAAAALERLARGGLPAARRAALVALVRGSLPRSTDGPESARQVTIPLVRALAELAIEVEELAVNRASARALIHRVRARVRRIGLEPIERAGEQSTLDRSRHEPIGRPISDGTPVVVVRPGYVWKAPTGDVLIARAVVQDRG